MTRGNLSDEELLAIENLLPAIHEWRYLILQLSPDALSMKIPPDSRLPIASVCLQDESHMLSEARFALHESYAHEIWYAKKKEEPVEMTAVFFAKYYSDDAALRLYAAGEDLANAILNMLEIPKETIAPFKKGPSSLQQAVGQYMVREKQDHPITIAIEQLISSKDWTEAIRYRNKWVHEQPPRLAGLGIGYSRENRWIENKDEKTRTLLVGGGDEPEFSIVDLRQIILNAFGQFFKFSLVCTEHYIALLQEQGIVRTENGISFKLFAK